MKSWEIEFSMQINGNEIVRIDLGRLVDELAVRGSLRIIYEDIVTVQVKGVSGITLQGSYQFGVDGLEGG